MTAKEQVLKKYPGAVCKRGLHPLFGWEYRLYLSEHQMSITGSAAKKAWAEAAERLKEGK